MGFKTLSFFCPVLGGPPGEAGSAMQRLSPGRARDHPVMDIVPNKVLSLSLSLLLPPLRRRVSLLSSFLRARVNTFILS